MGIFPNPQGQLTNKSFGEILQNFKLIQAFMFVLVRWKNEEDPIKNVDARAATTLSINF